MKKEQPKPDDIHAKALRLVEQSKRTISRSVEIRKRAEHILAILQNPDLN